MRKYKIDQEVELRTRRKEIFDALEKLIEKPPKINYQELLVCLMTQLLAVDHQIIKASFTHIFDEYV